MKPSLPLTAGIVWLIALTVFSRAAAGLIITDAARGPLPGSSLPALAVAIARGAEVIELELVLSGDDQPVLFSDIVLNGDTDVAEIFPDRARDDGLYYALDFTLAELDRLSVGAAASDAGLPRVRLASLADALALIRLLEHQLEAPVVLVAELKKSWFHGKENRDLSRAVVDTLARYGYGRQDDDLILAAYDAEELQRLHDDLLPAAGLQARIIQLIGDNSGTETMRRESDRWLPYNYDWMFTRFGLKALSAYADFIGLPPAALIDPSGTPQRPGYIEAAHALGLEILADPFDPPSASPPGFTGTLEELTDLCLRAAGFDALTTRHDERLRRHLSQGDTPARQAPSVQQQLIDRLIEQSARAGGRVLSERPPDLPN